MMHREQSIGEIRGLSRLAMAVAERKHELEVRLGLIKPSDGINIDPEV